MMLPENCIIKAQAVIFTASDNMNAVLFFSMASAIAHLEQAKFRPCILQVADIVLIVLKMRCIFGWQMDVKKPENLYPKNLNENSKTLKTQQPITDRYRKFYFEAGSLGLQTPCFPDALITMLCI